MLKNLEKNFKFFLFLFLPFSLVAGQAILSINLFLISIYTIIKISFFKNFRTFNKIEYKIIFIFFSVIILTTLIFSDFFSLKILLIYKFLFLLIFINIVLTEHPEFFKLYEYVIIFLFFFIFTDLIYQSISGFDFFGFYALGSNINRLTGPFGTGEYIPGSFIFFLCSPIILNKALFFFEKKSWSYDCLGLIVILSLIISIFITGERMSFIMLMAVIVLIFFFNKNRIKVLFSTIVGGLVVLLLIYNNNYFYERYKSFLKYLIPKNIEYKLEIKNYNSFYDSPWGAHYLTAYEIFKENPIYGSGIRSFRYECKKDKYDNINSIQKKNRCSTHPHNIYLEIISETGLIGFFIYLYLIFFILRKSYNIRKKKLNNIVSIFIIFFVIIVFPLKSTGSFFSNFYGTFLWINFSFLIYLLSRIKPKY